MAPDGRVDLLSRVAQSDKPKVLELGTPKLVELS